MSRRIEPNSDIPVVFGLAYDVAPGELAGETALVMLPGVGMNARDFAVRGFVEAMRKRELAVDAVMVDAGAGDYMSPTFGERLGAEVVDALLVEGYQRVWLAGISLGGYGAMRLLQERTEGIDGMLLLAPFLSTRGTIARIMHAGGLDGWSPLPAEREGVDEALLCWLKDHLAAGDLPIEIYLGWGEADRYADASRLLAARLPSDRIFRACGDHDWPTWETLWHDMLDAAPFAAGCAGFGLQ